MVMSATGDIWRPPLGFGGDRIGEPVADLVDGVERAGLLGGAGLGGARPAGRRLGRPRSKGAGLAADHFGGAGSGNGMWGVHALNVHGRRPMANGVWQRGIGISPIQCASDVRMHPTGKTLCQQKNRAGHLAMPGPVVNQRSLISLDQDTSVVRRRRCSIIASKPATRERALEPVAGSISGTPDTEINPPDRSESVSEIAFPPVAV